MANFVKINVGCDTWDKCYFEVSQEYTDAFGSFQVSVDSDFLREYRKALDVVYRFQDFVAKEIKNNDSK